ncbi:NAD(P)-binding protein [Macroventuria anomochaeta]|uniref:NAD(P)-binding protein n=1 Tax=Macroventuria anomochaeta TaxID=301207 RepID=A0ACB6S8P1_9PLEO|nr:NAD(P)-binding protein [Macroventuria anomochaeta]KAF2630377.1 NAD(P)-binding protein [Macroventuria anomochaeta]
MSRTLLLFGAGPGIGDNVAATFASSGSIDHIVLLGRNTDRLQNEAAVFVQKAASNVKVDTLRADLSDLDSIPKVLSQLDDLTKGEDIEVVYYNAARIKPTDPVLDVDVKEIEDDLRVTVLALHLISQHYIPLLQSTSKSSPTSKPALLVTNSHLPWDPVPQLISLSLVKGAQRTQVISLNRAFGESGVHCGLISVEGVVDPKNKVLNPANIAKKVLEFWQKGEGVEVNLKEPQQ